MPRQSTSISARPQRLRLSGEEKAQHDFIRLLGPYFSRAKFEDQGPQFLQRAFNIWFARWPLYLRDFEDADFMNHRRQSIEKDLANRLWWACFTPTEPEYTWQRYLSICEARYGVAAQNTQEASPTEVPQTRSDNNPPPKPRARPRARPRAKTGPDDNPQSNPQPSIPRPQPSPQPKRRTREPTPYPDLW